MILSTVNLHDYPTYQSKTIDLLNVVKTRDRHHVVHLQQLEPMFSFLLKLLLQNWVLIHVFKYIK